MTTTEPENDTEPVDCTASEQALSRLYKVRKGTVSFVDVPEIGFVVVEGEGEPEGPAFADALQALYAVSYTAHFAMKHDRGEAPRVMPLEAQWWVDDPDAWDIILRVADGTATMADVDRSLWRWRAMIAQPAPLDDTCIDRAITEAGAKKELPALARLRYERFREGPSAQIMHIGPYADEARSIVALHRALTDQGLRARGRHHEIYLGDPRRCAPERLRTILRQPVEPVDAAINDRS